MAIMVFMDIENDASDPNEPHFNVVEVLEGKHAGRIVVLPVLQGTRRLKLRRACYRLSNSKRDFAEGFACGLITERRARFTAAIVERAKAVHLTRSQLEWLENIARDHAGPRNWAGCPYGTFKALMRKGLVRHSPQFPHQEGFSQWDTWVVTDLGRRVLATARS